MSNISISDILTEEWCRGFDDRVAGKQPASRQDPYWDGWLTADAEAEHCTLLCFEDEEVEGPHLPGCGKNFKGID
jgi:hypothetical protein